MADQQMAEEYRGVRFRQLTPKLRWPVGEGLANQVTSERPRDERTKRFLDKDGTFVTFADDARIDIPRLLRTGALVIEDTNQRRGTKAQQAAETTNAPLRQPLADRPPREEPAAPSEEGGGQPG